MGPSSLTSGCHTVNWSSSSFFTGFYVIIHKPTIVYTIRKLNFPRACSNDPDDKFSTDWDKAWTRFKKQGKKTLFSGFSPNKYVSWNPRRSNYPLSEEVDPIKRTERSNLMLWTSPKFTLAGAIVIVSLLLIYTILAPTK